VGISLVLTHYRCNMTKEWEYPSYDSILASNALNWIQEALNNNKITQEMQVLEVIKILKLEAKK
jgi:hypothetical protein